MNFMRMLEAAWARNDSLVCVGLDPEPGRFPAKFANDPDAIFHFCAAIVDACADLVCCFKPQFAHFAAQRAEAALERLIAHIHAQHPGVPVILDAKRGDIGSTAAHYAFLDRTDRGVILLCRTSNPGARDLQDLFVDGRPLYQHVATLAAREWNANGNCALVVGATYPAELAAVRALVGDLPILVPGVGAQGGDVAAVVHNGKNSCGTGLMVSSSRAILYAGSGVDFAAAARRAAQALRDEINRYR